MLENDYYNVEKDRTKFQKLEHTTTSKIGHDLSNDYEIDYDDFITQITERKITERVQF